MVGDNMGTKRGVPRDTRRAADAAPRTGSGGQGRAEQRLQEVRAVSSGTPPRLVTWIARDLGLSEGEELGERRGCAGRVGSGAWVRTRKGPWAGLRAWEGRGWGGAGT